MIRHRFPDDYMGAFMLGFLLTIQGIVFLSLLTWSLLLITDPVEARRYLTRRE